MRKILPVFIFLVISPSAFSQTNNLDKWAVSFTPVAAVLSPTISWGLQPGVEYRISHRFTLLSEITFALGYNKDSAFSHREYFRIKPELRYNFEKRSRWVGSYIGLQLSYAYRKWDNLSGGSYYLKTGFEDSSIAYDQASITSPIFTSSFQMGTILNISDRFSIDFFWGMGTRTIFTHYSNVQNPSWQYYKRGFICGFPTPPAAYTIDRTLTRFHMNTGFRVLYYF